MKDWNEEDLFEEDWNEEDPFKEDWNEEEWLEEDSTGKDLLEEWIEKRSRLADQYQNNTGQAVEYAKNHMTAKPQAVVVKQPYAGWLNFILQEAGFIEGRDFIITPYHESLSPEEKALFDTRQWLFGQILFFMGMTEEDVEESIELGKSDPQVIREDISLMKITNGMATLEDNGFVIVRGGYASLNAVDVERHRIQPFSTAYDAPDFWKKAEILYDEYKKYKAKING